MAPISRVNMRHPWEMVPGPIIRRLPDACNQEFGLDIAEQYLSHLSEDERTSLEKEASVASS